MGWKKRKTETTEIGECVGKKIEQRKHGGGGGRKWRPAGCKGSKASRPRLRMGMRTRAADNDEIANDGCIDADGRDRDVLEREVELRD
eukprot:6214633-Pleurochrysis_carterae.AAC.3